MHALLVSLDSQPDILLKGAVLVLGRHRWCDVRIQSVRVSRRHCCLILTRDKVFVRDLGSTNGTRINGRHIEEGVLCPGEELSVAHFRYRLEWADSTGSGVICPD
jgi:pSer/pThr/pTyr-binding forkhead associated (FHA) protein